MPIETRVRILKKRRTKIVATLGPASSDPVTIGRLVEAGVDVFRLNFSHGEHATHRAACEAIRAESAAVGRHVAVLADLCGPKIRCGRFREGKIELGQGESVHVTTRDVSGEPGLIPTVYDALPGDVRTGDRILLDDGNLELAVESVEGTEVRCRVVHGGTLSDKKGINLPGVSVSAPSLTAKDRADARFALELGVDLLALSFVRRASDVQELRELVQQSGREVWIIAKIEKPEALDRIDEILDAADGVMVARGDMGVELPLEEVPVAQDLLVSLARSRGKPVIVATQMLESMTRNSRPTRAEVADVSHAVTIGADAIMLSAETASGEHPIEAVRIMDRIARQTEGFLWNQGAFGSITEDDRIPRPMPIGVAVPRATAQLSRDIGARAIIVISMTGTSAASISASRPGAPVLAVSSSERTCRRMSLLWGIVPVLVPAGPLDRPEDLARRLAVEQELATSGQAVLMVRGFTSDAATSAPSITVLAIA